jgi:hypothetical protein
MEDKRNRTSPTESSNNDSFKDAASLSTASSLSPVIGRASTHPLLGKTLLAFDFEAVSPLNPVTHKQGQMYDSELGLTWLTITESVLNTLRSGGIFELKNSELDLHNGQNDAYWTFASYLKSDSFRYLVENPHRTLLDYALERSRQRYSGNESRHPFLW